MNFNRDIKDVITSIKKKIQAINEEERKNHHPPQMLTLESLILGTKETVAGGGQEPVEYNVLLRRQQEQVYRKNRVLNPVALERRARIFHGADIHDGTLVNEDMELLKARAKADKYYQITDSDNYLNDLTLETFQKPWGKLEAHIKINRLIKYAEMLQVQYSLSAEEFRELRILLIGTVNRKEITRKADVDYDEETGELLTVHGLRWDDDQRTFKYERPGKGGPRKSGLGKRVPKRSIKVIKQFKDSDEDAKPQEKIPVLIQRKVELTGVTELNDAQKQMLQSKLGTLGSK